MIKPPKYLPMAKVVEVPPVNWLSGPQFAERIGCQYSTIARHVKAGNFPTDLCCVAPVNGRACVYLDYNSLVYDYLMKVHPRYRPKDFIPDSAEYRPLTEREWKRIRLGARPKRTGPKKLGDGQAAVDAGLEIKNLFPNDMHESKLIHEHKKIEKADLELKISKNQLVPIADVVTNMRMLAIEIKQGWDGFEQKVVPRLAATTDPREIKEILVDARKEVFDRIDKLENTKGVDG